MPPVSRILVLLLALAGVAAPLRAQVYLPDDPLWEDPDRLDMPAPAPFSYNDYFGFIVNTFDDPADYHGPALNANTLQEVPNSSWYTNRHYRERLPREALLRGPDVTGGPDRSAAWTVTEGKDEGVSVGLQIEDARGDVYLLKFDDPSYPEMASGAEVVVTKLFHALGYHVPENYVVYFDRERLVPADDATYEDARGRERPMDAAFIDEMLEKVYRYEDGRYRALASRFVAGSPIGPFRYYGTRSDDGNDLYPHEGRRELRGLRVFAAWLNHTDARGQNTLDSVVEEDGRQYVRHYLIDFGSTLGGGPLGPKRYESGFEPVVAPVKMLVRAVTFGFAGNDWLDIEYRDLPSVGRINVVDFEPETWRPGYQNPAFDRMDRADAFWAARQVAHFTDEELRALVEQGQYTDTMAVRYLTYVLAGRRDAIARTYLRHGGGVDRFRVDDGALAFDDLLARHGLAPQAPQRRYVWRPFSNADGSVGAPLARGTAAGDRVPLPAADAPFLAADLVTPDVGSTRVVLRAGPGGYEVVGLTRSDDVPEGAEAAVTRAAPPTRGAPGSRVR